MTCPYCAAFGRDLFGQTPSSPRAAAAGSHLPRRGPSMGAGEGVGDAQAPWRDGDEPSWPVGFGKPAGIGVGIASDGAGQAVGWGRH